MAGRRKSKRRAIFRITSPHPLFIVIIIIIIIIIINIIIEKLCDQHVTSTGQRKKSGRELNLRLSVHRSDALTIELRMTRGELGNVQSTCMTCRPV